MSGLRSASAVVAASLLAITAHVSVASEQQSAKPALTSTTLNQYAAPGSPAGKATAGMCAAMSVTTHYRNDARRCVVGGATLDPCFVTGLKGHVICDVDPRQPESGRLVAVPPTPAEDLDMSGPSASAWFVELEDGSVCRPLVTTGRPIKENIEIYGCKFADLVDGGAAILGELDDRTPVWTLQKAALNKSVIPYRFKWTAMVGVRSVWR